MKPPGGEWSGLVVLAVAGGMVLAGSGFIGGYLVGSLQHKPTAVIRDSTTATDSPSPSDMPTDNRTASPTSTPTPSPRPTPSPTPTPVQCWFGDFPYYPGSLAVAASSQGAEAWHTYAGARQVASYFTNGASQLAWHFQLISTNSVQWNYRMSRAPACRGSLVVMVDPAGGTLYQATPDNQ